MTEAPETPPAGRSRAMGKRGPRGPHKPEKPLEKVANALRKKVARGLERKKARHITAREFLQAILDCDMRTMVELNFTDIPSVKQRQIAAVTLMAYDEQRMPVKIIHEQQDALWSKSIQDAQDRSKNLRRERGSDGKAQEPVIIEPHPPTRDPGTRARHPPRPPA